MSRCVRRAFLCGEDNLTGKNYQHRKQWVVDKLGQLAGVFAIDVCAYAIMSNHSHLVLKINKAKAESWSIDEIIKRWTQLFSAGVLIQCYQAGLCYSEGEINKVYELCDIWRKRLMDISWFMRCLNESIARQANAEDKCTGRFWEGRFKSQALLDEQALLACMVYVDLNPVRAGISQTLEDSDFTSISQRIQAYSNQSVKTNNPEKQEKQSQILKTDNALTEQTSSTIQLADFIGSSQSSCGIAYSLSDYIQLADWTGRAVLDNSPHPGGLSLEQSSIHLDRGYSLAKRQFTLKKGYIAQTEPKIIHKLGIDPDIWIETVNSFTEHFYTFIGPKEKMGSICQQQQKKWLTGIHLCRRLFTMNNPLTI